MTVQTMEAVALQRVEELEREVTKLQTGWSGREALLEQAVTQANEATALAAAATAAKVRAEDELLTLRVLLEEARSSVVRLERENRTLKDCRCRG